MAVARVRLSWDSYFLRIAETVSLRGDCTRRQVGCVLVDAQHRIVSTGYNGAEPGGPSCLAGQCPRGLLSRDELPGYQEGNHDYSNCIAVHAEANALLFSRSVDLKGGTAYVTVVPCDGCDKLLKQVGLRVVHR